jgi:uracil-DNA glycosylase
VIFVDELAAAEIGSTFNFYREGPRANLLKQRLAEYLAKREGATVLLVGEAPGCRGARVSGIPFTSERQLTGTGPAEASATIVRRVLAELGIEGETLCWNVVPTHPGTESTNRRPTRNEVEGGIEFARRLARGRTILAVGRLAAVALDAPYVRHPSYGGASGFQEGLLRFAAGGRRVRRFNTSVPDVSPAPNRSR